MLACVLTVLGDSDQTVVDSLFVCLVKSDELPWRVIDIGSQGQSHPKAKSRSLAIEGCRYFAGSVLSGTAVKAPSATTPVSTRPTVTTS